MVPQAYTPIPCNFSRYLFVKLVFLPNSSMKNTLSIVLFLLVIFQVNAQKSIYIRPSSSVKINSSTLPGDGLNSPLNLNGNDYFSFYNYGLHYNTTSLDLGIGFGLTLNKKERIELSIAGDNASVKSALVYNSNYSSSLIGRSIARTTLDYQYVGYTGQRLNFRAMAGIGLLISMRQSSDVNPIKIELPNYTLLGLDEVFRYKGISSLLKLGIGMDVKTKKDKALCSFDVFWTYNLGGQTFISDTKTITIIENGQQTQNNFTNAVTSKGSGITFQLSFPIRVYTFGGKSRDKVE